MRHLLVYSSITGNTRLLAAAIAAALPPDTPVVDVKNAPDPAEYDCLSLGFWVNRGRPDPRMWEYMKGIKGKTVAAFGTMAAYPGSEHAEKVSRNVYRQLEGNTVLGCFLCQGKLSPKRFEDLMSGARVSPTHPMTPERRARLIEAGRHPDQKDLEDAARAFREFFSKV